MLNRMSCIAGILLVCAGNSAFAQKVVKEEPPMGAMQEG